MARIADRYEVLGDIGAGGMGIVQRARDERLGREVAVKVLPQTAVGDEHARRRLMREARAAAGLEHPGIVHVYDVGETPDGGAYLVMELVKGKSLRQHCEAGTLALPKRLAALVEVARALAFAHERGFVHRDIKPDNIMIRDDGRAVVLDFGLAKSSNEEGATVTAKGSFIGTPAYMAPEQARGAEIGAAVDQFALAVTVFEVFTGELPWKGSTALEIVSDILQGEPRCMRDLRPELPLAIDDAVARAMEKQPEDRFPDMNAFADALETASSLLEPAKPSLGKLALADTIAAPAATVPSGSISASVRPAPAPRAPPLGPKTIGALAVLGATAVAWLLASRMQDAPPPEKTVASPLANDGTVLACPALEASSFEHPEDAQGWLGSVAAHLACERAQVFLGRSTRTLVPAELLNLPHMPSNDFPLWPYDNPDARDRMLKGAKNADAWIDGKVERKLEGFKVTLILRTRDGSEVARGSGSQRLVYQAVRDAMVPLFERSAIPSAMDEKWLSRWMGGATPRGTLAMHDLHVALLSENPWAVSDECDALAKMPEQLGAMAGLVKTVCADKKGEPLGPRPVIGEDERADPAKLATSASVLRLFPIRSERERTELADLAKLLEADIAKEDDREAKALLATVAAEIHYTRGATDESRRLALVALGFTPKLVDLRGNAWHRLAFTVRESVTGEERAHTTWIPWEPFGYSHVEGSVTDGGAEQAHRTAALADRGYWSTWYGDELLRHGDTLGAGHLASITDNQPLQVTVTAAEGRPKEALDLATKFFAETPAQRTRSTDATSLAFAITQLSNILERPQTHVEDFTRRFLEPEPSPLTNGVVPLTNSLGVCTNAPKDIAGRCLSRVRALYDAGHFGAGFNGSADEIAGAERYVAGDYAGAAKLWRANVLRVNLTISVMHGVMADAFERSGDDDLADRTEWTDIDEKRPVSLACVRAALRAERRHDCATARKLAQRVIDAWDAADERPPSVDKMKKLLGRCVH